MLWTLTKVLRVPPQHLCNGTAKRKLEPSLWRPDSIWQLKTSQLRGVKTLSSKNNTRTKHKKKACFASQKLFKFNHRYRISRFLFDNLKNYKDKASLYHPAETFQTFFLISCISPPPTYFECQAQSKTICLVCSWSHFISSVWLNSCRDQSKRGPSSVSLISVK